MEKETYALVKAKLSFMDKIKFSLRSQKPECKGIIDEAERIVEEYILNCRLQGITLYKKRKKLNVKNIAISLAVVSAIVTLAYFIFV